jgi:small subunit ribosomal protein S6
MRKYETIFISDPDLQDQTRSDLFDKVRNIIAKENGIFLDFDDWGNKKLAYEIKKKFRGHYVCATYGGTGDLVKELERNLRLSDDVLKFMTILVSDNVTVEQLEQEVRERKEAAKPAAEQETGETETSSEEIDDAQASPATPVEDETVEETE